MPKYRNKILLLMLTIILCFPTIVSATDSYETSVSIPVRVKSNLEDSSDLFTFTLERKDGSSEFLPEQTQISIKQGEDGIFGPINYDKPGKYEYLIKQLPGDNKEITYDDTIYDVMVFVENTKDKSGNFTGGLTSTMVLKKDGVENKPTLVVFENTYEIKVPPKPEPKPTPKPTPKPSPKTGDQGIYISAIVLSIGLLGLLLINNKKKEIQ